MIDSYDDLEIMEFDPVDIDLDATMGDEICLISTKKRYGVYVCHIQDDEEDVDIGTVVIDFKSGVMVGYDETDESCCDIMFDELDLD